MADLSLLASNLIAHKDKICANRSNFETVWEQISEFVLPNRGDFITKRSPGERRDLRVFDTTAIQANEMLAAALFSGLTNPSSRWFNLRPQNKNALKSEAAKVWIDDVTTAMYTIFNSDESNFYQQFHELLLDLVAYGTAIMYIDEDVGNGIRFNTRHLSEIYIAENSNHVVDTVYRAFKLTARQASQQFGDEKLSANMKGSLIGQPHKEFDFLHCVMPRKDAERLYGEKISQVKDDRDVIGFYVDVEGKSIVDISGFYEMPYIVVRWEKLIGESYGRSPAWNALADIRMVNVMSETVIRGAQKQVDPPILVADDGVIMPMRMHPSGVNVGGVSSDGRPLIQPFQAGGNLNIGLEMMEQRRDAIRRAYFVDQFVPKEGTPVTATEYIQNSENSLRLTGPQLSRTQAEALSRIVNRLFAIGLRAKAFPPVPEELVGAKLDIEYVSPLVKNQRTQELLSLNKALDSSMGLIQFDPTLMDNFDGNKYIRRAAEIAGVPASDMRSDKEVKEIRAQRQQQQQQQQQAQEAQQVAETAAKLGVNVNG